MAAVRVGVIGVGVMGAEHVRLLADRVPGAVVTAIADAVPGRAAQVVAEHAVRSVRVVDPAALIDATDVDAVLVASSDATHADLVLACIAAGKPVLCEKPLAPTSAACLEVLAAEARRGRRLVSLGFMRRFDPGYVALRGDLAAGAIGQPLLAHCVHRNLANPGVPSELLVTGSLVHEIDVVRWLFDDEIVSVTVHTPRPSRRSAGTQDPIVAILRTGAGVLVDVEVFVNSGYGYEVRCEVVGEDGTLALDQHPPVIRRAAGVVGGGVVPDWRGRFEDAYREELTEWVAAVAAGREPALACARDGYVATAVAEAGVAALTSGRTVEITLADPPRTDS